MQGNSVNSPSGDNSVYSSNESNSANSPGEANCVNIPDTYANADCYLAEYVTNKLRKTKYKHEQFAHAMLKQPRLILALFRKYHCTDVEKKELLEISKFLLAKFKFNYSELNDSYIISQAKRRLNLKKDRLLEIERGMWDEKQKKILDIEIDIQKESNKK